MFGVRNDDPMLRMSASTAAVMATRVSGAMARAQRGESLFPEDLSTIRSVADDLRGEARVLRGEARPNVNDETSYAFGGASLRALQANRVPTGAASRDAATSLDELAAMLEDVATGSRRDETALETLRVLFKAVGAAVSAGLARTGESVERDTRSLVGA